MFSESCIIKKEREKWRKTELSGDKPTLKNRLSTPKTVPTLATFIDCDTDYGYRL